MLKREEYLQLLLLILSFRWLLSHGYRHPILQPTKSAFNVRLFSIPLADGLTLKIQGWCFIETLAFYYKAVLLGRGFRPNDSGNGEIRLGHRR